MKKRRVTAKDVAELAGVSQSAVSMILNNYKHISFTEETRLRVLEACDKLGTVPPAEAGCPAEKNYCW